MKRFILLPLLPLFILNALYAQTLNFGVKAGPQLVSITHVSDGKNVLLYHAGGLVDMSVIDHLNIQAEVLVSAQGLNDAESDHFKQRNLYLQLPVSARYQVWNRLSVHAGLYCGVLMSAKEKFNDGDMKETIDTKDDFKKVDAGIMTGAEYLMTKHIGVGMRVNLGLSKVFVDWDKSRQRVIQVFASYRFNESPF